MKLPERLDKLTPEKLDTFTEDKLRKLFDQANRQMRKCFEGGLTFGVDWPTLRMCEPEWYDRLDKLRKAIVKKVKVQQEV